MGTYYRITNIDRREFIDPGKHGDWGVKWYSIHSPDSPWGWLVVHALTGRWAGDRVRVSSDAEDGDGPEGYFDPEAKDVTLLLLASAVRSGAIRERDIGELWSPAALAALGEKPR